jgi:type II secretory pathway component GspD/PulD (secretin)
VCAGQESWRSRFGGYRAVVRALVVIGAATTCGLISVTPQATSGQEQPVVVQSGPVSGPTDAAVTPPTGSGAVPAGAAGAAQPGGQPGGQPEAKPGETPGEQAGGETSKEKAAEAETTVKRPSKPPRVPDPREFDVVPDENGRVKFFNFHGQLWPDVLQWLASIGGHSLDWQELPGDYINYTSNGEMSVPVIRDEFNRLLFERGFTLVLQNNLLLVVKLDKLDPSLLRRVEDEAELMDLPLHEFVKLTFRLPDELKADKAAEDVKLLLSRFAKVQPLMSTNRLLVIDVVTNLREVSQLVNAEYAAATGRIVPREFTIRYARADRVADQVMILLGLDPSSRRTPEELQVETQRLQLFTQMQQRGQDIGKFLRGDDAPVVFLAVNDRNNALIVNAPPKEMGVIERAVNLLDIPGGMLAGAGAVPLSMQRYSLVTIKPESIVAALRDIGDLDPRSQVKTDSDAKVVFANATPQDHEKIQAMIDQLDGTGRQFDVIWLRRLPAESVATTIRNLMVGKEEKKEDNSRGYIFYGYRGNENQDTESPNKGFRIDADTRNNRLLLWANDAELTEVRKLLVKLGEIPGESGNPHTVRAFHAGDGTAAEELLKQLRRVWPSIQPNPLEIEPSSPADVVPGDREDQQPTPPPAEIEKSEGQREARTEPSVFGVGHATDTSKTLGHARVVSPSYKSSSNQSLAWADPIGAPDRLSAAIDEREGDDEPSGAAEPPNSAPIYISITPDGRLMLRSRDTRALDHLEELLDRMAPARKDFEVFYLTHASASLVTLNLEEYFEDDGKKGSDSNDAYMAGWYGFRYQSDDDDGLGGDGGLSQRKPLRFIYDFDTNSILVSNATPEQLATIRSLIEIYDRPISEDSISARRFQIFTIQHARANEIATTIKDVYRDLLSSKDKVFERETGEKEQTSQSTNYIRLFGNPDDTEKKPTKIKASFAGALSVGVDEASNTVIVSAQEEWMPSIAQMIRHLDVAAEPYRETVQVVNTSVSGKSLQAALARVVGGETGAKPTKEETEKPPTEIPAQGSADKSPPAAQTSNGD